MHASLGPMIKERGVPHFLIILPQKVRFTEPNSVLLEFAVLQSPVHYQTVLDRCARNIICPEWLVLLKWLLQKMSRDHQLFPDKCVLQNLKLGIQLGVWPPLHVVSIRLLHWLCILLAHRYPVSPFHCTACLARHRPHPPPDIQLTPDTLVLVH